jgi:glycosyltransferase involved in cell wall biosynthesis
MMQAMWLTWERQTRNLSMAEHLNAEYVELTYSGSRLVRYLLLSIKTLLVIRKQKPQIIYFQNPSIILGLLCTVVKIIAPKITVIGDFHNVALAKSKTAFINKFVCKNIDLTLVSNSFLLPRVEEMGGKGFVFPDPLPNHKVPMHLSSEKFILFISSWAEDEPINDVLTAYIKSDLAKNNIQLYVTGRVKPNKLDQPLPYYQNKGVKFSGFVDEEKYWQLLYSSIFNIDLTTRDDCLVCGAYESLSLGQPILLSGNAASRDYFDTFGIYTDNSIDDLCMQFISLINEHPQIKSQASAATQYFRRKDAENRAKLESFLLNKSL